MTVDFSTFLKPFRYIWDYRRWVSVFYFHSHELCVVLKSNSRHSVNEQPSTDSHVYRLCCVLYIYGERERRWERYIISYRKNADHVTKVFSLSTLFFSFSLFVCEKKINKCFCFNYFHHHSRRSEWKWGELWRFSFCLSLILIVVDVVVVWCNRK